MSHTRTSRERPRAKQACQDSTSLHVDGSVTACSSALVEGEVPMPEHVSSYTTKSFEVLDFLKPRWDIWPILRHGEELFLHSLFSAVVKSLRMVNHASSGVCCQTYLKSLHCVGLIGMPIQSSPIVCFSLSQTGRIPPSPNWLVKDG